MDVLRVAIGIPLAIFDIAFKTVSPDPFYFEKKHALKYAQKHPEVLPARIETPRQLRKRYVECLGRECWLNSGTKGTWLRRIFEMFAVKKEKEGKKGLVWTEQSLSWFLEASFPPDTPATAALWQPCVPMLYRLLLKIGSFPWHVEPMKSEVDGDVFRCAVAEMMRIDPYRYRVRMTVEERKKQLDARFRRLLFQCLATVPTVVTKVAEEGDLEKQPEEKGDAETRREADDEDLRYALAIVKKNNYWMHDDYPKLLLSVGVHPLPDPSSLPTSWSGELSGKIDGADMRKLLKLLLALQSNSRNPGLACSEGDLGDLETVTESVLKNMLNVEGEVRWEGFDMVLGESHPHLLDSFKVLFGLFMPPEIERGQVWYHERDPFHSAFAETENSKSPVQDAIKILHKIRGQPSVQTEKPVEG